MINSKEKFLTEVEKRLHTRFTLDNSGGKVSEIERAELLGFMRAGVFMNIVTSTEMDCLIEQTFVSVYGMTPQQRDRERSQKGLFPEEQKDYSAYDYPAYMRRNHTDK